MAFKSKPADNSPPGKIIRKTSKAATGGAALFLAFLMFMMFRFGTGTSSKDGDGQPTPQAGDPLATTAPPSQMPPQTVIPTASSTTAVRDNHQASLSTEERQALAGNVLTVLIDERDYLLQLPGDDEPVYRPLAMQRLLEIAALAPGDENGIRVRILRRENARASAEEQLKLDLARAGITSDHIYMPEQFMP